MNAMIKRFFCCAVALSGIAMLGAVNYSLYRLRWH